MNSSPVIEVNGLHLRYGEFTAVDGISFQVQPGEVFALLGTNGAGKTTTMDVLEGYQKPSDGNVRVFGRDPFAERPKIAADIGIMLQEAGFFKDLTVAETVTAWRRFTPDPLGRDEVLELVDLTRQAKTKVRKLSGGEKRKLDLALAVLGKPKLLFLDEPTTGLDPNARRHTWHLLQDMVRSRNMTILLTTHYMEEAEFLADRLAIMDRGRIVRHGPVAEVVRRNTDSHITFTTTDARVADAIPTPSGAQLHRIGAAVEIHTSQAQATLTELMAWAATHQVVLADLEVRSASLEDVFLDIASTGGAAQ
jgi:ABC-2 type transport system ATP-binding protein